MNKGLPNNFKLAINNPKLNLNKISFISASTDQNINPYWL